jgi:hypothetical protein
MKPPKVYRGKRFKLEPTTNLGRARIRIAKLLHTHKAIKFEKLLLRIFGPMPRGSEA